MTRLPSSTGFLLLTLFIVSGCGQRSTSTDQLITGFGSFLSPDGSMRLEVTRRKQSMIDFSGEVDFEVFDTASGRKLAGDSIGWAGMRWCLCWETPSKLWGYGSDIQYFKRFEFRPDATAVETRIDDTIPVPPVVWDFLPSSLKEEYRTSSEPGPSAGKEPREGQTDFPALIVDSSPRIEGFLSVMALNTPRLLSNAGSSAGRGQGVEKDSRRS